MNASLASSCFWRMLAAASLCVLSIPGNWPALAGSDRSGKVGQKPETKTINDKTHCEQSASRILLFDNACSDEAIKYSKLFSTEFRREALPRISECYRRSHDEVLGFEKLLFEFTIDVKGKVVSVVVSRLTNQQKKEIKAQSISCLENAITETVFTAPPNSKALRVRYPFQVKPVLPMVPAPVEPLKKEGSEKKTPSRDSSCQGVRENKPTPKDTSSDTTNSTTPTDPAKGTDSRDE